MDLLNILSHEGMLCFSSESLHGVDSNEYTQYTIFKIKKKITLNYPKSAAENFFHVAHE